MAKSKKSKKSGSSGHKASAAAEISQTTSQDNTPSNQNIIHTSANETADLDLADDTEGENNDLISSEPPIPEKLDPHRDLLKFKHDFNSIEPRNSTQMGITQKSPALTEPQNASNTTDSVEENNTSQTIIASESNEEEEEHESINELTEGEEDDFGSFDEASFEEYEHASEQQAYPYTDPKDMKISPEKVLLILDHILPVAGTNKSPMAASLLGDEAQLQFEHLSKQPKLQPPNWTKLKLRHNLLLKLGIPINLDELANTGSSSGIKNKSHRNESTSESELDWSRFNIPDIESLSISKDARQNLLNKTSETLPIMERENMEDTSELYLKSLLPEALERKLAQIRSNRDQLLILGCIWHEKLEDLKASQNVYESVVHSMVGYNQKIQRKELLENLLRSKSKRGKKTF